MAKAHPNIYAVIPLPCQWTHGQPGTLPSNTSGGSNIINLELITTAIPKSDEPHYYIGI